MQFSLEYVQFAKARIVVVSPSMFTLHTLHAQLLWLRCFFLCLLFFWSSRIRLQPIPASWTYFEISPANTCSFSPPSVQVCRSRSSFILFRSVYHFPLQLPILPLTEYMFVVLLIYVLVFSFVQPGTSLDITENLFCRTQILSRFGWTQILFLHRNVQILQNLSLLLCPKYP